MRPIARAIAGGEDEIGTNPLQSKRIILGVLGAIGAGKSHVSGRIAALADARVVDADALAHVALRAAAADGRLAATLGPTAVRDGAPDREAIAGMVFEDRARLRALEELLHPPVHAEIRAAIDAHVRGEGPALLVLDVPLLIEVGLDRACDALWFVDTTEATRLERARARGLSPEQIAGREQFQTPTERKRARAGRVIDNDTSPEALDAALRAGLAELGVLTSPNTPVQR